MRLVRCFFGDGDFRGGESSQVGWTISEWQVQVVQTVGMQLQEPMDMHRDLQTGRRTRRNLARGVGRDATSLSAPTLFVPLCPIKLVYLSLLQHFHVAPSILDGMIPHHVIASDL